jgi:hypothetical protein
MKLSIRIAVLLAVAAVLSPVRALADDKHDRGGSILGDLPTIPERIVPTVPANNDVNPYGVAFVPKGFGEGGPLHPGDILVSNFNNGMNQQGTGTTHRTDPAALVIGPTGLAYDQHRDVLYVASTGHNEIFAIPFARELHKDAGQGVVIYQDATHLHGPLGLALAPNGDLITANGDAVNTGGTQNALVEFTPQGKFVAQFQVDPGAGGGAFGLAFSSGDEDIRFATVDDDQNTLDIWNLRGH